MHVRLCVASINKIFFEKKTEKAKKTNEKLAFRGCVCVEKENICRCCCRVPCRKVQAPQLLVCAKPNNHTSLRPLNGMMRALWAQFLFSPLSGHNRNWIETKVEKLPQKNRAFFGLFLLDLRCDPKKSAKKNPEKESLGQNIVFQFTCLNFNEAHLSFQVYVCGQCQVESCYFFFFFIIFLSCAIFLFYINKLYVEEVHRTAYKTIETKIDCGYVINFWK